MTIRHGTPTHEEARPTRCDTWRVRSRQSRRALAIQRSAMAFARGAWTGAFTIRPPIAVNAASDAAVNFVSRSRIKNFRQPARRASQTRGAPLNKRVAVSRVLTVPEREVLTQPDGQLVLPRETRSAAMTGFSAPTRLDRRSALVTGLVHVRPPAVGLQAPGR